MVAVFGLEAAAIDKIDPTANHIASCKSWTILLACAAAPEAVSIVAVVAVAVLVPPWQSVHVHSEGGEAHSHVAISAFGVDCHLKVVKST